MVCYNYKWMPLIPEAKHQVIHQSLSRVPSSVRQRIQHVHQTKET